MANLFLILNGDDVGAKIGDAITSKDHQSLAQISNSIKQAHQMCDEWVKENGGQVIASSGDENFYNIPEELSDKLSELLDKYHETTGLTLTGGIGNDIEEASKAMIYGKMSGKDQVVHYEPAIDDYILAHHLQSEQVTEDKKNQEMEQKEGVDTPTPTEDIKKQPEKNPKTTEKQDDDKSMVKIPVDEVVDEHERLVDTLKSPDHKDDLEEAKEQQKELDQYKQQQSESKEGEKQEDNASQEQEDNVPEMDYYDFPYTNNPKTPQENSQDEGNEDIPNLEMDDLVNPEHHPEKQPIQNEEDPTEEDPKEKEAKDSTVDQMQQEENKEEEDQEDSADKDLKQKVIEALMQFKENKQELEQLKETNPELYQANISMLRSMIEMAKKLKVTIETQDETMEKNEQKPVK